MKAIYLIFSAILMFFLFRPDETRGQVDTAWARIYNGPQFEDVSTASCSDQAGALYLTGYSTSNSWSDCLTIKYSSNGSTRWTRQFDGTGRQGDGAKDMAIDDSANLYIAGYTCDTIPGNWTTNALVMKYDSAGNLKWLGIWDAEPNYAEGGNVATDIAIDSACNVYVAGYYYAINPYQGYNFFLLKYNASGIFQWARNYNGPGGYADDYPAALTVDKAGNAVITGKSRQSVYLYTEDYATIRYDPQGNVRWVRRYDGPPGYDDIPMAIATDDSCNVYVTGYSNYYSYNMLTIKYDSAGNEKRVERYTGFWENRGNDIVLDSQRNIYVTGSYRDSYLTVKYAPDWTMLWAKEYYFPGGSGGGIRLLATGDTGVIVAGTSVGDIATLRYDAGGNLKWIHRFNGNADGTDWVTDIAPGPAAAVYVTGAVADSVNGDDYVALKLIPAVNRVVRNVEIPSGDIRCFDATATITVAGNGTFFIVRSGGSATLVAGQAITMLPGVTVEPGGTLSALITTDGTFCNSLFNTYYSPLSVAGRADAEPAGTGFTVFPNPAHDRCTVRWNEEQPSSACVIEIRDMTGRLLLSLDHPGNGDVVVSLADFQKGLYLFTVRSATTSKTAKIVRI